MELNLKVTLPDDYFTLVPDHNGWNGQEGTRQEFVRRMAVGYLRGLYKNAWAAQNPAPTPPAVVVGVEII